jgi:hypothetical protein
MKSLSHFTRRLAGTALAVAAPLSLAAGGAWAADTNSAVNTNAQLIAAGSLVILDLNGAGAGTDLLISTPAVTELSLLFNAECSVDAADDSTYIAIEIIVNGVVIPPTGIDRAFCTSTGDNALQHWVSAEANAYRVVGAGNHIIRARAQLVGEVAGDNGRIDDTSMIVLETP